MPDLVFIHADESCLGNRRDRASPGGAAGLVEVWKDGRWARRDYWVSEPATTNNRMALRSAIEPLAALRRTCRIRFTSDSQYLVLGMSEWVPGWIERGWKRKTGPIENLELWRGVVEAARRHEVVWHWIRGHAGHPRNEYANHLATEAAKDLGESGGLVPSALEEWLLAERDAGRYLDFDDFAGPLGEWPEVSLAGDGDGS
ncbi:MAG TPA: RNase H family protein [Longimicrobiales bacterium]|nr:RNase H family protein [Longimicrobiales bacterium]